MAAIVVLGALVLVAGQFVYYGRQFVIDRLTSRSLGTLAPGYAATQDGIKAYAFLIDGLGIAVLGTGLAPRFPQFGVAALVCGIFVFAIFSAVAIAGEVRTYRALKR